MTYCKYTGNCPRLAPRDAKYAVRWHGGSFAVSLIYRLGPTERVYLATTSHDDLVRRVNAVKEALAGRPGGVFYINEWRQVIVPVAGDTDYYYVGEYHENLEFDFDGKILSGRPVGPDGQKLQPGETWWGPHPGIPYKLRAGVRDIAYELQIGPNRIREVRLSEIVGADAAARTADKIRRVRDERGGRFYVNEWRAIFTPITHRGEIRYVYIGQLEDSDPWFPKPEMQLP